MNSIKRNSNYLYAESTMPTEKEAFEIASELLYQQVKEYAEGKKSFQNRDILIRDIAQVRDSIQLQRGDMVKVFLYVKKSDIFPMAQGNGIPEIPSEMQGGVCIPYHQEPVSVSQDTLPRDREAENQAEHSVCQCQLLHAGPNQASRNQGKIPSGFPLRSSATGIILSFGMEWA